MREPPNDTRPERQLFKSRKKRKKTHERSRRPDHDDAAGSDSFFFGVAFLVAAAFFAGALAGTLALAAGALATRPVLVFLRSVALAAAGCEMLEDGTG